MGTDTFVPATDPRVWLAGIAAIALFLLLSGLVVWIWRWLTGPRCVCGARMVLCPGCDQDRCPACDPYDPVCVCDREVAR